MIQIKKENGPEYQARLRYQWRNKIDPRGRAVMLELADWVWNEFGKILTITCLTRTKEENERLGGYEFSAHLFGRAEDIRSHVFSQEEIEAIEKHLDETWNNVPNQPDFLFVKRHAALTGPHLHINITWAYHIRNYAT